MKNQLEKTLSNGNPVVFTFKKESVCLNLQDLFEEIDFILVGSFSKKIEIDFRIGVTDISIKKERETTELALVINGSEPILCYSCTEAMDVIDTFFNCS